MNNNKFIYPKDMLKLGRSSWDMSTRVKTSFMHGDAVPILWMEVLPGDEIALDVAELIRMSTPIAPIMDDIIFHMAAYFEPMRLVFENWEELCGANKDGAWTVGMEDVVVPFSEYGTGEGALIPALDLDCQGCFTTHNYGSSLAPYKYHTLADFITGIHKFNSDLKLNILPWRTYYDIWNNNYRSQVVSAPIAVDKSANNAIVVDEECCKTMFRKCEPLGKLADLFTKMLPEPQKGDAVKFLSDLIPVGVVSSETADSGVISFEDTGALVEGKFTPVTLEVDGDAAGLWSDNLVADLSQSINTINDLRYAFQLQKFLEKDARFGTRYFEYLNAHFGITIAEGVVQLPQWLGETNFRINVDQVLSTAGYAASSSTSVGAPGANSVTGKKDKLFRFTAKEHGYIMIICGCRHNHTYSNGITKQLQHLSKLDFYHPEFANIGEVAVTEAELSAYFDGDSYDAVGYQEAWYEYRYLPSKAIGLLNPNNTGALKFWTLAERPTSYYQLNENFIYEGREAISDALVTGATGPDYIGDFLFKFRMTRVMPAYSIPGFADHH